MATTVLEILRKLGELDPEDVIFAKEPWHWESEAEVLRLTEELGVPAEATAAGLKYLLEVDVARQVLEEFKGRANVALETKCDRIIEYAIFDA